jgi:hypothetical protein
MERRDFFGFTAMIGGGMLLSACNEGNATAAATTQPKPTGAVTLYYEIRVAGPEKATVLGNIDTLITAMTGKTGYLSLSLKQMTGESTMVKNYPNALKGVLDRGFMSNAKVPNFYSLFIRFDSYDNMIASGAQAWFTANIVPSLFAYAVVNGTPTKTSVALDYYEGVYVTVAAGDRNGIYTQAADIKTFLQHQATYDPVSDAHVTVENHVMIKDKNLAVFNEKIQVLLTTAQQTYMPLDGGTTGYGTPGTLDVGNTDYRKAVTTEILQNAFYDGDLRSYLMHGVWESVADHENSHIDSRFQAAAGPTGAYVVVGPVEPFYDTIKQG